MSLQNFRFSHRMRVRWAEVDMQKIVFNAHYLMYLDTAIAGYWRAMTLPYEEAMHRLGGDLYVKKASLEYHGSARFDEQIDVGLKCSSIGRSSIIFTGEIFHAGTLLINAELIYVFADPATQKSRPVPDALRTMLRGFEEGEPMFTIRMGHEPDLICDAEKLKAEALREQGSRSDQTTGAFETGGLLAVAYNRMGQAVACGSLLKSAMTDPGAMRLDDIVVRHMLSGSGLGRALVDALVNAANLGGAKQLDVLTPQSGQRFFERQGFVLSGTAEDLQGVQHVPMVLQILRSSCNRPVR